MSRERYGFSNQAKRFMHLTYDRNCMAEDSCEQKNDMHVHHLTGCYVSELKGLDPKDIVNPEQNALLLCPDHSNSLDEQERIHINEIKMGFDNPPIPVDVREIGDGRVEAFIPNEGIIIFK